MDRVKTTVMLPKELARMAKVWGRRMGTGQNGCLSMGLVFFLVEVSAIEPMQKRIKILRDLEKTFQSLIKEAKEGA